MDRGDLTELHYITPIANLPSIMRHGIVCNRRSKRLGASSIAMQDVQSIRAKRAVPGGRMLHDYACLYFNARNPMLYLRLSQRSTLCVLSVNPAVLDLPEVVITDQNAASKWVRFAAGPKGVNIVSRHRTFAEWWTHPEDQIEEWRHKAAMCAEILVPDCVPPTFIQAAYVSDSVANQRIRELALGVKTTINARLFFQ